MSLTCVCYAQNNDKENVMFPPTYKATIMVDYFNTGRGVDRRDFQYVDYTRSSAIAGIASTNRVKVMEPDDNVDLRTYDPQNVSNTEYVKNRYALMKNLGVDYVIEGEVLSIDAVKSKDSKNWEGSTSYNVRVVDVNTGNVVQKINALRTDTKSYESTPEAAIQASCNKIGGIMRVYILDNIRIGGQVLDITDVKNNVEVKEVHINVGPKNAAYEGVKFEVYSVNPATGKANVKKIGEIKITKNLSGEESLAKVTKGGKEIKEAQDNGQILEILSVKSGFWDGF